MTQTDFWGILAIIVSSLSAIGMLVYGFINGKHQNKNFDSSTIDNLETSLKTATDNYSALSKAFEEYKKLTDAKLVRLEARISSLSKENVCLKSDNRKLIASNSILTTENKILMKRNDKLTRWVEKLCLQLKGAGIIPASIDDM